ncbi:MAG: HPF/RaiA family ribosome-associated protein [Chromatiales bacterium]|jgi:ribosome-associated translation inhibitor RaiA
MKMLFQQGMVPVDGPVREEAEAIRDGLLGRFRHRVTDVEVRVDEEERTGFKRCEVAVRLGAGLSIIGRHRGRDLHRALYQAFARAAAQVRRLGRKPRRGGAPGGAQVVA